MKQKLVLTFHLYAHFSFVHTICTTFYMKLPMKTIVQQTDWMSLRDTRASPGDRTPLSWDWWECAPRTLLPFAPGVLLKCSEGRQHHPHWKGWLSAPVCQRGSKIKGLTRSFESSNVWTLLTAPEQTLVASAGNCFMAQGFQFLALPSKLNPSPEGRLPNKQRLKLTQEAEEAWVPYLWWIPPWWICTILRSILATCILNVDYCIVNIDVLVDALPISSKSKQQLKETLKNFRILSWGRLVLLKIKPVTIELQKGAKP